MIAFQFTLSIIIIAGAAITHRQASRFGRADFGFNRERIGVVPIPLDLRSKIDVLRGEILHHPEVLYVSGSAGVPLVWTDERAVRDPEKEPENALDMNAYGVGVDFTEALEMSLVSGSGFSAATGSGDRFILNRTAVRRLGWTEPLGRMLEVGDRTGIVIGVTEDFLFDDIGFGVPPAVLYLEREPLPLLLVKFGPSMDESEFMGLLREKWSAVVPELPFSAFTLDEHFEETFRFLDSIAGFLGAGIPIFTMILSFLAALAAVGVQVLRVVRADPVDGLRSE